jgi:hypothetical protein
VAKLNRKEPAKLLIASAHVREQPPQDGILGERSGERPGKPRLLIRRRLTAGQLCLHGHVPLLSAA